MAKLTDLVFILNCEISPWNLKIVWWWPIFRSFSSLVMIRSIFLIEMRPWKTCQISVCLAAIKNSKRKWSCFHLNGEISSWNLKVLLWWLISKSFSSLVMIRSIFLVEMYYWKHWVFPAVNIHVKSEYTNCDQRLLNNVGGETQGGAMRPNQIGVLVSLRSTVATILSQLGLARTRTRGRHQLGLDRVTKKLTSVSPMACKGLMTRQGFDSPNLK